MSGNSPSLVLQKPPPLALVPPQAALTRPLPSRLWRGGSGPGRLRRPPVPQSHPKHGRQAAFVGLPAGSLQSRGFSSLPAGDLLTGTGRAPPTVCCPKHALGALVPGHGTGQ
uniref:Uncharacterized protein n=1 Tax=Chelonoidis abingdonii TaxID=106734 RepID=A0A8C0IN69_CHEAB